MNEKQEINQGVIILFVVMVLLTGGMIVEHSKLALIPLVITVITGAYGLSKIGEKKW
jgi:hypothetical protein